MKLKTKWANGLLSLLFSNLSRQAQWIHSSFVVREIFGGFFFRAIVRDFLLCFLLVILLAEIFETQFFFFLGVFSSNSRGVSATTFNQRTKT